MSQAKSIVCFGGTFDPVHNGHLIVARSLAEQRGFDKILLVPSGLPPHKLPARASAADRLAMLRLATEGDELFEISEAEIHRPGRSFTYDTLCLLRQEYGPATELNWVIGADMLADLPNWHRAKDILDLARLLVAVRPPWHEKLDAVLHNLADVLGLQAAQRLRENVLATPLIDISSTEIRRRLARGLPIRHWVPDAVNAYILGQGIYKS